MERMMGWITTGDVRIFHFINHQLQCRLLDIVMPRMTHIGGATFSITILVLIMMLSPSPVRLWAFEALISLTVSHLIVRVIKSSYPRPRPYLTLSDTRTFPNPLTDYSFPSGHTTAVFSVAGVFALYSPLLAALLLPLALMVGLSRMYLGLHYPTDCAIGASIGMVTALLVVKISLFF